MNTSPALTAELRGRLADAASYSIRADAAEFETAAVTPPDRSPHPSSARANIALSLCSSSSRYFRLAWLWLR